MKTKPGIISLLILTASVVAFCALLFSPARAHAGLLYTVTELGPLTAGNSITSRGTVNGINASGQVVGQTGGTAVLWSGGTATNLAPIGGTSSNALGINASGQVVGYSYTTANGPYRATLWNGLVATDLDGGYVGGLSQGSAINASGQIAGYDGPGNARHARLWNGTTPIDLGTLGGADSFAFGINASGQVVGRAYTSGNHDSHATLWNGLAATDLGTISVNDSVAFAINDSGTIVGIGYTAGFLKHAVVWNGATVTDLGTLGGTESAATSINASGQIVGYIQQGASTIGQPFLYTEGTMYDLSTLLVPGSGVTNLSVSPFGNVINDLGQIAASGNIDGRTVALLLTPAPVPEPGSVLLLLIGLGMTVGARWRNART
jgi:probable HAF family extracellular repeat protein